MSILLEIGMPDDLEDGEIFPEDDMEEFADLPEKVSKLQDLGGMKDREVVKTAKHGRNKWEQDKEKKSPKFTRVQNYRKKMYQYQYQDPKWNGVTKYHAAVSWWDQFQET